jgi:hypothetical protein
MEHLKRLALGLLEMLRIAAWLLIGYGGVYLFIAHTWVIAPAFILMWAYILGRNEYGR